MATEDSVHADDFKFPWWEEPTMTKAGPKAVRLFQYYADCDRKRIDAYRAYESLYLNRDIFGNGYTSSYKAAFDIGASEYSRVPFNVIKLCVDAVHARLTRPAVAIEFLPAGANQSLRRRAKQATQFVNQMTHQDNLRDQESKSELDALIYNLGAIKTCPHMIVDKVENHRVHPRDLFVDPVETASSGRPSHLYQRQFVSRGRLQRLFPRYKSKIAMAGRLTDRTQTGGDFAEQQNQSTIDSQAGMVEVVEAWKLPSWVDSKGESSGDGKHIIFIDGAVLYYDTWDEPDFPFSFVRWKDDPSLGFFGVSLAEELMGLHFDINTSILHTEKAIELMPKPFVLVPEDGEVSEGQLGNVPGIILNYTGRAPDIRLNNSVPQDVVNYIEVQFQRALQVSRLTALALPEAAGSRAETGAALDTVVDIQSTELSPAFKKREDFVIRLAEQNMVAGRLLNERLKSEGKGGFKTVLRKDRNTVQAVEWDLFALDPRYDSYVVQAQPASALGQTFGQRLNHVKELLGLGLIPLSRAFKLLDVPDLQSEMNLQNASLDFIERIMEEILDEGIYTPPEPTMDLRLALKVTQKHINLAQAMQVEDQYVTMLYDFLRDVDELINQEQQATQMQAQGMQPGFAGTPPAMDISGAPPAVASGMPQGVQ